MKWIVPVFVYLAVIVGLFVVDHAWIALVIFHLTIVISLLLARSRLPLRILFTSREIRWGLVSILLCGSTGISLFLLWDAFGIPGDLSRRMEAMGLNRTIWIPFLAYFTLINPLIEEYFWRGYLGSDTSNLAPSDFLYSGFHGLILLDKVETGMIVLTLALLVLAGWFWRQLAQIDGGLLAPVLGHMAADFTILTAVYLRVTP